MKLKTFIACLFFPLGILYSDPYLGASYSQAVTIVEHQKSLDESVLLKMAYGAFVGYECPVNDYSYVAFEAGAEVSGSIGLYEMMLLGIYHDRVHQGNGAYINCRPGMKFLSDYMEIQGILGVKCSHFTYDHRSIHRDALLGSAQLGLGILVSPLNHFSIRGELNQEFYPVRFQSYRPESLSATFSLVWKM